MHTMMGHFCACLDIANFFMEDFEEKTLAQVTTNCCTCYVTLMILFCHLATQTREVGEVSWTPELSSQEYSVHHGNREGQPPPFSWQGHLQQSWWLPQPQGLLKTYPHKPLSEPWIRSPSFQHTSHSCNLGAMCEEESLHDKLEFLKTTFSSRYDVSSTRWWEPQSPNRRPPQSLSCLMSKRNTYALAECWPAA